MSGTYTNSQTNTYTEARARYVLGKMKDDFYNVAYRGFTTITGEKILDWWEDVSFVVYEKALIKCELQFKWTGGEAAIVYEVVADGSIHVDADSASHNFHQIPADADVGILIKRDRNNETVSAYLQRRGWVSGGNFIVSDGGTTSGYSKDGYGFNTKSVGL